jgi:hypothetical protein
VKNIIVLIGLISLISWSVSDRKSKKNTLKSQDEEFQIDTLIINGQRIIKTSTLSNKRFNCLVKLNGDTIIPFENFYSKFSILDINDDGYDDLRVFIFSNTPNSCNSYLFDSGNKIFRLIENSDWDIKQIKNTKHYYSYARGGCADWNWESYLSKIENYKLIHIGLIDGRGCGSDEEKTLEKPEIKIYKIFSELEKDILIEVLPYKKYIPEFEDKWTFVENYWIENNTSFEN